MASVSLVLVLLATLILQVFIPGFPKETILLLAGLNFGIFWGTLINWVGMILAAQVGYEVVLHSVKVGGRFSHIIQEYEHSRLVTSLRDRGNWGLFFVRLIPYAPNDVLSLLAGALFLPRRGFILVSVITALPYAMVFAYLGHLGSQFIDQRLVWVINLCLFAVSLLVVGIHYLQQKSRSPAI